MFKRKMGGGKLQVLEPAKISTMFDTPQTIILNASNTDSYSITNLPEWCTLDSITGEIICNPTTYITGRSAYDVVLTNIEGSTTIINGFVIDLYKAHDSVQSLDVPNVPVITETTEQNTIKSATHDNMKSNICQTPNGNWHALDWYLPNQGGENLHQLVILDLENDVLTINDSKIPKVLTNLIYAKQADNGKTTFHAHTTSASTTIMEYDYTTKSINEFLIPELSTITHAVNYRPFSLDPYDRKLHFASSSQADNQQGVVCSFDPATATFTVINS